MEELLKLLPDIYVAPIVSRLMYDKLCEVRIANERPVRICYDGAYYFLCKSGITRDRDAAFIARSAEAEWVVMRACDRSLYTVTETLKRGFIAVGGGIRIGVCGSGVSENGTISALKEFSSVTIRIPHEVKGCAAKLASRVAADGLRNTLIVSPPAAGKTTILRDLCRIISDGGYNVLLCDEKREIAAAVNGVATLDVGCRTDIICGVSKSTVIEMAIANMRPDVIMTDELFESDIPAVRRAGTCGVAVVATIHAGGLNDLKSKREFISSGADELFLLYATLSGAPLYDVAISEGLK